MSIDTLKTISGIGFILFLSVAWFQLYVHPTQDLVIKIHDCAAAIERPMTRAAFKKCQEQYNE